MLEEHFSAYRTFLLLRSVFNGVLVGNPLSVLFRFTMNGPESTSVYCLTGTYCIHKLMGVGFQSTNKIRFVEQDKTCGASLPPLRNPVHLETTGGGSNGMAHVSGANIRDSNIHNCSAATSFLVR